MSTAIPIPPGGVPSTAPAGTPPASTNTAVADTAPSLLIRRVTTSRELRSSDEIAEHPKIRRTVGNRESRHRM
ncbi:hypothetical protein ACQPYE_28165 [Actinosynnema sp. CA-299493]